MGPPGGEGLGQRLFLQLQALQRGWVLSHRLTVHSDVRIQTCKHTNVRTQMQRRACAHTHNGAVTCPRPSHADTQPQRCSQGTVHTRTHPHAHMTVPQTVQDVHTQTRDCGCAHSARCTLTRTLVARTHAHSSHAHSCTLVTHTLVHTHARHTRARRPHTDYFCCPRQRLPLFLTERQSSGTGGPSLEAGFELCLWASVVLSVDWDRRQLLPRLLEALGASVGASAGPSGCPLFL